MTCQKPTFTVTLTASEAMLLGKGLIHASLEAKPYDAQEAAEARWWRVLGEALERKAQDLRPIEASL